MVKGNRRACYSSPLHHHLAPAPHGAAQRSPHSTAGEEASGPCPGVRLSPCSCWASLALAGRQLHKVGTPPPPSWAWMLAESRSLGARCTQHQGEGCRSQCIKMETFPAATPLCPTRQPYGHSHLWCAAISSRQLGHRERGWMQGRVLRAGAGGMGLAGQWTWDISKLLLWAEKEAEMLFLEKWDSLGKETKHGKLFN